VKTYLQKFFTMSKKSNYITTNRSKHYLKIHLIFAELQLVSKPGQVLLPPNYKYLPTANQTVEYTVAVLLPSICKPLPTEFIVATESGMVLLPPICKPLPTWITEANFSRLVLLPPICKPLPTRPS